MTARCDAKKDPVASGQRILTQPFKTLEGAKDSLKHSEDKTKVALEELEKESKAITAFIRSSA